MVGIVGVVILFGFFVDVLVSIGALASEREVSSGMFISGLDILVITSVAGELRGVGGEVGARSATMKEIFGMGSFDFVSVIAFVPLSIDRVHI